MASMAWQSQISSLDRYEMIRKIKASSMTEAVAAETKAFQQASSKEEYERLCKDVSDHSDHDASMTALDAHESESPGMRIGHYDSCHLFAEGVTSEVYRSGDVALKVIVAHQNLEPHNPQREIKILQRLRSPCISLQETFRDQEQRLVLAFPYKQHTLASILQSAALETSQVKSIFRDILSALRSVHSQGIIHRDIKPSAILLDSPDGPAYLADFGTAWAPDLSIHSEPQDDKILDIGTGPYRAPEVLFGNKSYGPPVDMWGLGVMLAEASTQPPTPLFESRAVHEDGNQLGLILSIFKTLGTPTRETWPEAAHFKVAPFELWTLFPPRPWSTILPDCDPGIRELIADLVRFDGKRASAAQALEHPCLSS
ncbi:protein kinase domain-containing protein [Sarocladium implicatum]|nr:protein kinase domain-containing protein [Sarocladium implicatum]